VHFRNENVFPVFLSSLEHIPLRWEEFLHLLAESECVSDYAELLWGGFSIQLFCLPQSVTPPTIYASTSELLSVTRGCHSFKSAEHPAEVRRLVESDLEKYFSDTDFILSEKSFCLLYPNFIEVGCKSLTCNALKGPGKVGFAHGCHSGYFIKAQGVLRIRLDIAFGFLNTV